MDMDTLLETLDNRIKTNEALVNSIEGYLVLYRDRDNQINGILRRGLECFKAVIRELMEIKAELTR